jgi:hypothetical protein
MKKILFLILMPFIVFAQKHTQRIGGGLEYMVGDNWFLSPHITHEYQVGKRVFLTSNLGLIHKNIFNEFNGVKTTIQRLMLDFDVKFAIIKYRNNYLKVGAGPSLWLKNEVRPQVKKEFIIDDPRLDPIYPKSTYENRYHKGINIGYNATAELDISVSKKLSLLINMDWIYIKKVGLDALNKYPSVALGVGGLYKLR